MEKRILSQHNASLLALTALLATLIGCGGTGTNPVSGTIKFEGQPMSGGGSIQFVPLDVEAKPAGVIDEDGNYTLGTFSENDGAVAGKHRVEIYQNEVLTPAKFTEVPDPDADGNEGEAQEEPISPEILIADEDRIPESYGTPQSTLTATVTSGDNDINFDIKRE